MSSDDEDFEDMMMASDYPLLCKRRAGHMPNMEGAQDDAQDEVRAELDADHVAEVERRVDVLAGAHDGGA